MTTTTATIASKGCKGTGITEELAQSLHANLGQKILAVVELVADSRGEKLNGNEKVTLSILTVEPAPNGVTVDHLRELAAAFHYERRLATDGPKIEGLDGPEPKVKDVLAAGARHRPHPYLASTLSTDDNAICDVCGLLADAPVHAAADRDDAPITDDEPLTEPGDEDDEDLDDKDAALEAAEEAQDDRDKGDDPWDQGPPPAASSPFDLPDNAA